jgi:hypothetical protein
VVEPVEPVCELVLDKDWEQLVLKRVAKLKLNRLRA